MGCFYVALGGGGVWFFLTSHDWSKIGNDGFGVLQKG